MHPSQLDLITKSLEESKFSEDYNVEILEYSKSLANNDLPIIFSLPDLSFKMGFPFHVVKNIIEEKESHYKFFKIKKKTGGYRWIASPDEQLKRIQKWIYLNILKKIPEHECSYGFVSNKSIVDNAKKHVGQDVILNIDIYRFFDSVEQKRIGGVFKKLGYHANLAYSMAELLTVQMKNSYWDELKQEEVLTEEFLNRRPEILPQGSPASPRLANYLAYSLDSKLKSLADKLGVNYSRYADDLTFSGAFEKIPSINTIQKIIGEEGFIINQDKIKYLKQSNRQIVTGLVVNDKISLPHI